MSKEDFLTNISSVEDLKQLKVPFEKALTKLEEIVNSQQEDEISLENSIHNFKLSRILSEYCQEILNQAKVEVEELIKNKNI